MDLQEMLGDAFHEGMSIDEINTALSGKKFADLSTGNYVDKNKYDADLKAKDSEIQRKAEALSQKMSDDEKKAAAEAEKDALIERLEQQIKNQTIDTNRTKAETLTTDVRTILDIKADDEGYKGLLDTLSNIDGDRPSVVATYINKLVKESYEKGKKDATKDSLGKFADGVGKQSTPGKEEVGSFGKKLAESTKSKVDPNYYFKNE
jgi:hypothetical protein